MPESNDTSSTSSSSSLTTTQPNQAQSQQNQAQVTEKPSHYTYLKGFRVEQCALFLQHKCTQHRPYTCFYWHFKNQRRRRPIRKRDGMFNYNPDVYCEKYDEQTGVCSNGDECPNVHRNAGDTEKRYHLRYYKTATCIHETDSKGNCSKNGAHCAFAHGPADVRPPVYDLKEMSLLSQEKESEEIVDNEKILNLQQTLDKEKQLNEDPKWNDTNYVLINYKTEQCKRPPRLCRQGFACPQYHNSRDKRRNPSVFKYRSTPCPNVKQGDDWLEPSVCENGDLCKYCHSRTEQQFHPEIYKSSKCNDMISTGYCPRGPFCAFAHVEHELKTQRTHSTSESSNSDYTLENFMTTVLSGEKSAVNSLSEVTLSESHEQKVYNKAIGAERKVSPNNVEDHVSSPSSTSSSSSSPLQQKNTESTTSPKNLVNTSNTQELSLLTNLTNVPPSNANSLNSLNNIAALTSAFTNNLVIDYEKEKLRQDLINQTELSKKLELLCCQYRQWVDKLTIDVNEWKSKYLRCESEKKNLEIQMLNKLKS